MNYKNLILENKILLSIGKIADENNLKCYVIGGFVRDFFLGIKSKDIDIVCIGNGIELAEKVAKNYNTKLTIYKNFGTAQTKIQDWEIEFVGARKESYNKDSRNPIVQTGSLEDDQNRRDFTINALAISLNSDTLGNLLDPFNGITDLREKLIRTPLDPNKTFSDDPLRMFRAIRFATKLAFTIDKKVFSSIENNIKRLKIISKERIINEINLTLMTEQPSRGFLLYFNSGMLYYFLPEMCKLEGREFKNGFSHKDNFYHTLKVLDNVANRSQNLWLRWAAILHDIAKPLCKRFNKYLGFSFHGHEEKGAKMVPMIFKRLGLTLGKEMEYVKTLVKLHLRPIALVDDIVTDSAIRRLIYDAGDCIEDLMVLCKADITSYNPDIVKQYLKNLELVEKKIQEVEERDRIKNFEPVIDGEIIMKTFNLKPSKIIGLIKNEIKEAILDGIIKNEYEEVYNFMLKISKKYLNPT